MSETKIHRLKVLSTDDPSFAEVARFVNPPPVRPDGRGEFFPAYTGFNIGSGSDVDISYLYVAAGPYRPHSGFDRHLYTEEMFIAIEGDFYFPAAPCRHPEDPEDVPYPEDFHCWRINERYIFIYLLNVWHNGCWPVDPTKMVKFVMVLSGHRAAREGGKVDHLTGRFPEEGMGIIVDLP